MHVNNAMGARLFVQVVDVLGTDKEPIAESPLKFCQGKVGGIRFGDGSHTTAHRIKLPDEPRIPQPSKRRSDLFDSVVAPQPIDAAKCGNATFCADAGAGQNEHVIGRREFHDGRNRPMLIARHRHTSKPTSSVTLTAAQIAQSEQPRFGKTAAYLLRREPTPGPEIDRNRVAWRSCFDNSFLKNPYLSHGNQGTRMVRSNIRASM